MKIRNDFVSNSSSSSFVLFGAAFSENDLTQLLKDHLKDDERALEIAYEVFSDEGLQCICDYDGESAYVGLEPDSMKDDETLKAFKQRIADNVNGVIGSNEVNANDIEYFHGVDYDGSLQFD